MILNVLPADNGSQKKNKQQSRCNLSTIDRAISLFCKSLAAMSLGGRSDVKLYERERKNERIHRYNLQKPKERTGDELEEQFDPHQEEVGG
jgi:hypothetical protein